MQKGQKPKAKKKKKIKKIYIYKQRVKKDNPILK